MIISHKYRFIFIKTLKTAGTSIEVFLSQHCGIDDVLTPILPPVEAHFPRNYKGLANPLPVLWNNRGRKIPVTLGNVLRGHKFYNHIPARIIKKRIPGSIWDNYFKFCVERNPWDKTLSHYYMVNARKRGRLTLEEYLEKGKFCINYPIYTDAHKRILVDRVIHYESLLDGLREVFGQLGIPFEGTLGVTAKSEYRKDRRPYQQIFTSAQRSIIHRAFADEIRMHGYTF